MTPDPQTVLVTGAGSGIGRAIALALARDGHQVVASMREVREKNRDRADELAQVAMQEDIALEVLALDVLSEVGCRAAVDHIVARHARLDVVVNNAGMLMQGLTEAFSVDQVARIIDTNALSWLRVNRAALPVMRRQGHGVLMYVGSTTSRIHEPFLGPYIASKVAGDALAEIMGMEVRPFGIESVILVPGAFTSGTKHFAHAQPPAHAAIEQQYGELASRMDGLGKQLSAIDADNGAPLDVSAVGAAAPRVGNPTRSAAVSGDHRWAAQGHRGARRAASREASCLPARDGAGRPDLGASLECHRRRSETMSESRTKAAIVTGASRGIGKAIALRLADDGFAVAVGYAGERALAEATVVDIVDRGGQAIAVKADVANAADVDDLFRTTLQAFGRVDVVVSNAGVMDLAPIASENIDAFDRMMTINVRGTFLVMAKAAEMLGAGGRIVALSTSVIAKSTPGYGPYIASKSAVEGLVRVLANEMRGRDITVNAVAPGPTATELFLKGKSAPQIEALAGLSPLGRLGKAEDVANAVSFLAGDGGGWVNAQIVRSNGGFA
ncbi:NAD(P)-dependent dehydrogenase, short-chain alcohol dehydrogenase family [Variovorax sp. OK212]|nr:NAD(P)-dependent dehydrogenase, short-chain alcohol dehydrogenase family [Variovorax sp. OK202]SFE53511.1 NAD(P)-dependent dehydrogenase, short-chain alcohol dehydrogenase family [Variovorax sp. OK212]